MCPQMLQKSLEIRTLNNIACYKFINQHIRGFRRYVHAYHLAVERYERGIKGITANYHEFTDFGTQYLPLHPLHPEVSWQLQNFLHALQCQLVLSAGNTRRDSQ